MPLKDQHIVLLGGAGLVGQNLLIALGELNYSNITVIDKQPHNLQLIATLHPGVNRICADLSEPGKWQEAIEQADVLVMLQAQIGNSDSQLFHRNNIQASELILETAVKSRPYLIHISSSVVNSKANDDYVLTKTRQEEMVRDSNLDWVILRPTLMFGHFDRKHLGWLSRFMEKSPVFPIPGNGRYTRQPLYAKDFCHIIASCIKSQPVNQIHNISGQEQVDYLDIIKGIKKYSGARSLLVHVPYWMFHSLLKTYALFDHNPPFTTQQLEALVIDEVFDLIDWEQVFDIKATPFSRAIEETFSPSKYNEYVLEF